jgi:hypothetical protein
MARQGKKSVLMEIKTSLILSLDCGGGFFALNRGGLGSD